MWQHCNLSSVIPVSHILTDLDRLFIIQILHHIRKMLNRVRHKGECIKTKTLKKIRKAMEAKRDLKTLLKLEKLRLVYGVEGRLLNY